MLTLKRIFPQITLALLSFPLEEARREKSALNRKIIEICSNTLDS